MQCVEFDGSTILKYFRATNKGNIVVMYNIKALIQNLLNSYCFEKRQTRLMGEQRREKAKMTLETVNCYIRMTRIRCCWPLARSNAVSIDTMDHIYFMSSARQFVRKAVYKNTVPAKIVRWIVCCYHTKTK